MADSKKKFLVSGILTVSFAEMVEATDEYEARAIVEGKKGVDLAWQSEELEITEVGEDS